MIFGKRIEMKTKSKYIFSCRGSTLQIRSVKELFGELDDGQLEDLVEVYKEDFGIHGYDPHVVLR